MLRKLTATDNSTATTALPRAPGNSQAGLNRLSQANLVC
jgi:hypothetical protein